MPMNILIAVDLSDLTPKVLECAKQFASTTSAKCFIVHVADPDPIFVGFEAGPQFTRDQRAERFRSEHREIEALAEGFRSKDVKCVPLLIQGPTVETLLEEARSVDADLIVMGSHGKGWAKRALIGSVSEGVLRRSEIPMLIVPASPEKGYS